MDWISSASSPHDIRRRMARIRSLTAFVFAVLFGGSAIGFDKLIVLEDPRRFDQLLLPDEKKDELTKLGAAHRTRRFRTIASHVGVSASKLLSPRLYQDRDSVAKLNHVYTDKEARRALLTDEISDANKFLDQLEALLTEAELHRIDALVLQRVDCEEAPFWLLYNRRLQKRLNVTHDQLERLDQLYWKVFELIRDPYHRTREPEWRRQIGEDEFQILTEQQREEIKQIQQTLGDHHD